MAHNHDASAWSKHSDKWAGSVQQITAAPCRELLDMIFKLSAPTHDSPRFFDNGAGSGMLTSMILQAHPKARITAADVSPGMIDTLNAEIKKQGWTTVTTIMADATDLRAAGIKDASFTFTAGTAFLPFVPDPAKAISEMARITEPGGIVAVSTWSRVSWVPLWEEAVQKTCDPSYKAPLLFHPDTTEQDDVENLLVGAGLQKVTTKVFKCYHAFKASVEAATEEFYGMGNPSIQLLHRGFTTEQIEQTRPAFVEAYSRTYNGTDDRQVEIAVLAVGQKPVA